MKTLILTLILCGAVATPLIAQDATPAAGKQADESKRKGGKFARKLRHNRMARSIWRELTPEEREAVKERLKQRREQRSAKREERRAQWEAMTPEEREAAKAKAAERRAEAAKRMAELRERLKGMTPEERKAELDRLREEFRKKREEEK